MNLIKLGTTYLNFDQVEVVRDLSPGGGAPKLARVEFRRGHVLDIVAHAQELLDWLSAQSEDVLGPTT